MGIIQIVLILLAVAIFILILRKSSSRSEPKKLQSRYNRFLSAYTNYVLGIACLAVLSFLLDDTGIVEKENPSELFGWFAGIGMNSLVSLVVLVPIAFIAKLWKNKESTNEMKTSQIIGLALMTLGVLISMVLIGKALVS